MRRVRGLLVGTLILVACATGGTAAPVAVPASDPTPTETARVVATTPRPVHVRFFVASESTNSVWVLEGEPLAVTARIDVGAFPHNISVSPDGKWVAVANRMAGTASIIDPFAMKEVARVMVGRQPHEILWAPDSKTIFVGSEREPYIWRIEAGTWKTLSPLPVGVPQHTLAIWKDRPNDLWFTVTNMDVGNDLRVYDLATSKITLIDVMDVHDVYFTPDGSEVWTSSSGFLCKPSDRMVIYDPLAKTVKQEIHFPGHYPFHTIKYGRDATFYVDQTETMVLSDHTTESLLVVDWRARAISSSALLAQPELPAKGKCGIEPFHTAYTPGRYYVTSNADDSVRVVDAKSLGILQRVQVTTPHGIVFVPLP